VTTSLANTVFTEVLARIAAAAPSPGGGAAGALAVALGIACGTKAIRVSLKHQPRNLALRDVADSLQTLSAAVTALADADGIAFEQLLGAYQLPKTTLQEQQARRQAIGDAAARAAQVGQSINDHAQRAAALLETVQDAIHSNIRSDLTAAQHLLVANQSIQQQNIAENLAIASKFRS
jgi:methenyltetrahydrofolate cyclohydrolase